MRTSPASTLRAWEADRDLSGTVLLTRHGDTLFEGCYGLANRAAAVPWGPSGDKCTRGCS